MSRGASRATAPKVRRRRSLILSVIALTSAVWQPTVATAGAIAACAGYGTAVVTGTVTIDGINEVSGVVASRRRDVLWIEEDSGNPERIYAIDGSGAELATVDVMNADNRDWEDIALTGRRIWIGDIGDNRETRESIQVYWFREPRPSESSVSARVLELRYEDGPHNAEAMVVDGARRELYIFTKQDGTTSVYKVSVRGLQGGESMTLTKIAEPPLNTVTAADLGPEGIIVKSGSGYLHRWTSARTVGTSLARTPCRAPAGPGESLGFARGGGGVGRGLYAIPEGLTPAVYFTPLT